MAARARKDSIMSGFRNSVALLAAGFGIAACATDTPGRPNLWNNRSVYSENQPVVEHTNYVFDVRAGGSGVSNAEIERLADWFESVQLRYGDRISIEDPTQSPEARADVARLVAQYGMLLSEGAPVTPGEVPPGAVRIVVRRASASVPGCPNYRQAAIPGSRNAMETNYGCATNSNLAAMIANPDDLVLGQQGNGSGDAATAAKAIRQYRDAPPTGAQGLEKSSTKQGGN